jgi:oxygen-dependent protoporphyrinogen oxidase
LTDATAAKTQRETSLLISTLNPSTLHSLLTAEQRLPHLTANPSTNVGLVNVVYPLPSRAIHPDGFGYLVPRAPEDDGLPPALPGSPSKSNKSGVIGVIFDSTTLPVDPTPDAVEHVTKLTIMLGGPHWRVKEDIPKDTETLIALAQEHLKSVFPVLNGVEPVLIRGWIHRDCIPTYLPGHGARLHELYQILSGDSSSTTTTGCSPASGASAWAGKLVLAGSGYGGVGVNDCVGAAEGIVRALEKRWKQDQHGLADGEGVKDVPVTGLERWKNWD